MDLLLEQFLKDEVTAEVFEIEFNKLSDDDKAKALANPGLTKKIADANRQGIDSLKGVRAAKKIIEGETPNLAANLRKENLAKAAQRFFEKFKITPENQQSYLDNLNQTYKETVSEDLLFSGLERAYAADHAGELISDRDTLNKMKEEGEQFNVDHAGAPGGVGDKNPDGSKRDPEVVSWMRQAAAKGTPFVSYEAAEKALSQGTHRVIG